MTVTQYLLSAAGVWVLVIGAVLFVGRRITVPATPSTLEFDTPEQIDALVRGA